MIQIRALSVLLGPRRRPTHAVNNVTLTIGQGEILALVGESGSGKTTLGRAILGLQRESSGDILLDGRIVSGLSPRKARQARADIQYVHQDAAAALDPWWSIGATLREALKIHRIGPEAERRSLTRDMLSALGLEPEAERRYPHELSGGQLRRVALARILLLRPRLLILDEPTSGLDMSVQATLLQLLLDLRRTAGLTYLFISHDLSVVRRLADRVAIMQAGQVMELAPTAQVFAAPEHPYTRELLASMPRLDSAPSRLARQPGPVS